VVAPTTAARMPYAAQSNPPYRPARLPATERGPAGSVAAIMPSPAVSAVAQWAVAVQLAPAPTRTFLTEGIEGSGSAAAGTIRATQGKSGLRAAAEHRDTVASGSSNRPGLSSEAATSALADSVADSAYAPRPAPPAKLPPAQPKRSSVIVQRTPLPAVLSRSRSQSGSSAAGIVAASASSGSAARATATGHGPPRSLEKWTAELLASMPKGLVGLDALDDL
jgi:hypothetical protein